MCCLDHFPIAEFRCGFLQTNPFVYMHCSLDVLKVAECRCWFLQFHQNQQRTKTYKLTNVQLLALLPHRHAKAAVLRWGPLSQRIGG